jgi:hypothetical protein
MEHPEVAEDGIGLLFDGTEQDEPRQRAGRQVLVLVIGWLLVIAVVATALVVTAPAIVPAIHDFVVGLESWSMQPSAPTQLP